MRNTNNDWNNFFASSDKPIVITETERHKDNVINTILMIVLVTGALVGGIEIGRQQVQQKLITDLQDGKVDCEVTTYTNKKEKFTEVRVGRIAGGLTALE